MKIDEILEKFVKDEKYLVDGKFMKKKMFKIYRKILRRFRKKGLFVKTVTDLKKCFKEYCIEINNSMDGLDYGSNYIRNMINNIMVHFRNAIKTLTSIYEIEPYKPFNIGKCFFGNNKVSVRFIRSLKGKHLIRYFDARHFKITEDWFIASYDIIRKIFDERHTKKSFVGPGTIVRAIREKNNILDFHFRDISKEEEPVFRSFIMNNISYGFNRKNIFFIKLSDLKSVLDVIGAL